MNVKHRVALSEAERQSLTRLSNGGVIAARRLKRIQILLAVDAGRDDTATAAGLGVGRSTVYRIKRRFVDDGLEAALSERPRRGASRKLSAKDEALLVATACSKAPEGRRRWILNLLADAMVELTDDAVAVLHA